MTPKKRRLRISTTHFIFATSFALVILVLSLLARDYQWALTIVAGAAIGIVYNFWGTEPGPQAVTASRSLEYASDVPARRLDRDRPHAALVTRGPYSGEYAIILRSEESWSVVVSPRKLVARRPSAGYYELSDADLDDLLRDELGASVIKSGLYADRVLDGFGV